MLVTPRQMISAGRDNQDQETNKQLTAKDTTKQVADVEMLSEYNESDEEEKVQYDDNEVTRKQIGSKRLDEIFQVISCVKIVESDDKYSV